MSFRPLLRVLLCSSTLLSLLPASALAWKSDRGDGYFVNPPLNADYPDPDIIRVGADFYFATTTFVNAPGLRLLHSEDLVNWHIVGHVIPTLTGRPEYSMQNGTAYRHGVFAPSLRHHKGMFYIAVTPVGQNTRIYRSQNIQGPWVVNELNAGAFDPGLFIDDDGTPYIATSGGWDGTISLLKLNASLTAVVEKTKIHYIKGAEGSKLIKREGWYYLFNALPSKLALTVSRAKSLSGPWETVPQLDDRSGGHQGALVDLPNGEWFGFVMKDNGPIGRITNLSPVFWKDGWPVWGTPEAPGRVPESARKPIQGKAERQPATSDDFACRELGQQWQWNHNPEDSRWSLTERPGFLRLRPLPAPDFWHARNTLTQKGQGPWCRGEVKLDLSNLRPGDRCGFGTLGKFNGHIGVHCTQQGDLRLFMRVIEDGGNSEERAADIALECKELHLRTDMDFRSNKATCSYSLDGRQWTKLGGEFALGYDWRTGTFQGQQFALFCYTEGQSQGFVDADYFRFFTKQ